ncbi:MAG: VacB/RNase II family 3'-5' exoribonuclease [Proteobacteria bacterium]|nr:VacB/RNase II family 3'-5' exoribonuclease [Pseudomonadota bacterium]
MKVSVENVHQVLQQSYPKGLTLRDLLFALGQKKSKKTLTRKCLRKLAQKKLCKKKDSRFYSLIGQPLRKNSNRTTRHGRHQVLIRPSGNSKRNQTKSKPINDRPPSEEKAILNVLWDHKVPQKFQKAILVDCDKFPRRVFYSKSDSRTDLRDLQFITIDGEDAKDFDDAIYGERQGTGYRIWISIADVAEYVRENSRIDKEAFARGTSVYIPGTVYPMLPEALSNHLCSLKAGVNRKTLTCEIVLDDQCEVKGTKIYESLVKIKHRLSYEQVDAFFETGDLQSRTDFSSLSNNILLYKEIAEKLSHKREKRGSINFSLPENKFVFDKQGKITDIKKSFQTLANRLVEQFMLEANENIGKFCDRNALPIMWRNHAHPMPEKTKDLKSLFWQYKQKLPKLETSFDFNKILSRIKNSVHKDILEYSLLRSMSQARYETERLGHFGLAATHYCHFTSPIRRYPDLVVHRALKNLIHDRKRGLLSANIPVHCSNREREAIKVERKVVKFKKALFMEDKVGNTYDLKVSGLNWNGIFVETSNPYVEGFIHLSAISDDHYKYNEENQTIEGKNTGKKITFGITLTGKLQRINWKNLSPEFSWVCWRRSF